MEGTFIDKTCRICLKDYEDLQRLNNISDYTGVIKNVANIEILLDELIPSKICLNCISLLLLSNMVRVKVVEAEQKWLDYLCDEGVFDEKPVAKTQVMCRICMSDVDDETINDFSIYFLPEKITDTFLNIREYHSHKDIPEKLCKKCIDDLQVSYQVVEACETMQVHEIPEQKCVICHKSCKIKYHNGIKELTGLILMLTDVPDQKTVDIIRNGRYCDTCVNNLRTTISFRYKSYKSEEVLKLQFEKYLKESTSDTTMNIEYLDDCTSDYMPEMKIEYEIIEPNTQDAYFAPPTADDSDSDDEDDFFTLQLNTPPTQIIHKCPQCIANFTHEQDLLIHYDIMHVTKGTLCSECGMNCKNIASLRHHKIVIHYQVFTHLCEICGRLFSGKAKYQSHYVTHFDERNVMCSHCPATFKTKKALILHMRTHTGEKPYACETCHKRFSHYSDMKRHTYTHSGNYPYNCEICLKGFVKKNFLRNHMQQHEKGKEKLRKINE